MLLEARLKEDEAHGISSPKMHTISPSSIRNYRMSSNVNENKGIRSKVQQKAENYYIVEDSVLSTISYLFTVAATHLIIGRPDTLHHHAKLRQLSKGAHTLVTWLVPPITALLYIQSYRGFLLVLTIPLHLYSKEQQQN